MGGPECRLFAMLAKSMAMSHLEVDTTLGDERHKLKPVHGHLMRPASATCHARGSSDEDDVGW